MPHYACMVQEGQPAEGARDRLAEGLKRLVTDAGIDAVTAFSGAEALATIPVYEPDVVLLDVGLPDIEGTEVAQNVRERWPQIPIIFMTGHHDTGDITTLRKPFDIEELLDRIAALEDQP